MMFLPLVTTLLLAAAAVAAPNTSAMAVPTWTAPWPDVNAPLAGYTLLQTTQTEVYHAVPSIGTYNHAVMFDFFNGTFLLSWKNSPKNEDEPSQRVLYSQSADGKVWTPTDGKNILFPSMNSKENSKVALFAEPAVHLNGHQYAAASPNQFCLYPDQLYADVLLMRRVFGIGKFGPIFWVNAKIPHKFDEASKREGVLTLKDVDTETKEDMKKLLDSTQLPCGGVGTLKCEACINGCQKYSDVPGCTDGHDKTCHIGNERTHYTVPHSNADVILYRKYNYLQASVRLAPNATWSQIMNTTIPDVMSNINAGHLPGERVYLVSNAVPRIKHKSSRSASVLQFRDPLTVAVSDDGWAFSKAWAVMSCTQHNTTDQPNGCELRYPGNAKNLGPSYPQAISVLWPSMEGLWVSSSNNKEDIWVMHVPFDELK